MDFIAITESWLNDEIDDHLLSINGYTIYRKDRAHCRGGGVCAFVSTDVPSTRRLDLDNSAFECLWVWLRPHRLPRPLSGIICCVLYNPPDTHSQEQRDLVSLIIETLDLVRSTHPDCGIVILGDFNGLDFSDVLSHHDLKQVVRTSTRGINVLDLIVTNLAGLYNIPVVTAPLGTSDHSSVEWSSLTSTIGSSVNRGATKCRVRRFPQSACDTFGRWCSAHV